MSKSKSQLLEILIFTIAIYDCHLVLLAHIIHLTSHRILLFFSLIPSQPRLKNSKNYVLRQHTPIKLIDCKTKFLSFLYKVTLNKATKCHFLYCLKLEDKEEKKLKKIIAPEIHWWNGVFRGIFVMQSKLFSECVLQAFWGGILEFSIQNDDRFVNAALGED